MAFDSMHLAMLDFVQYSNGVFDLSRNWAKLIIQYSEIIRSGEKKFFLPSNSQVKWKWHSQCMYVLLYIISCFVSFDPTEQCTGIATITSQPVISINKLYFPHLRAIIAVERPNYQPNWIKPNWSGILWYGLFICNAYKQSAYSPHDRSRSHIEN